MRHPTSHSHRMNETTPTAPTIDGDSRLSARRVRSELNLEQWSIWLPANSNRDPVPRVLKRETKTPTGETVFAEVEIAASRKGTLTTEDQRTYYALVEQHQRNRRPDNLVYFSLRSLARSLGKHWGSRTLETLVDSLTRLRANTIVWKNSYRDASTGTTQEELNFFNIVTDLKVVSAKRDGHTTRAEGYFKLHDAIIVNLERNLTRPVLLDVVLKFKGEVAQILYTRLDRILSKDIATYECRTKELFADLGLEGKKYAYPGGRKQLLEPAIAELEGVPLSNGQAIRSATLERTADGKDLKLVVRRGRLLRRNGTPEPPPNDIQPEPHPYEKRPGEDGVEPKQPIQAPPARGAELLEYFHKAFFGTQTLTVPPTRKHRDLADAMVASHGEALARYIVDFAKAEAEMTRFRIATFGAVANYIDRAVTAHTLEQAELKRQEERRRESERLAEVERRLEARQQRGYQLFRELSDEVRNAIMARTRADLMRDDRWRTADFTSDLTKLIFEKTAEERARNWLLEMEQTSTR